MCMAWYSEHIWHIAFCDKCVNVCTQRKKSFWDKMCAAVQTVQHFLCTKCAWRKIWTLDSLHNAYYFPSPSTFTVMSIIASLVGQQVCKSAYIIPNSAYTVTSYYPIVLCMQCMLKHHNTYRNIIALSVHVCTCLSYSVICTYGTTTNYPVVLHICSALRLSLIVPQGSSVVHISVYITH